MMRVRGLTALLIAVCMMLNGSGALLAAEVGRADGPQGIVDELPQEPEIPSVELENNDDYIEPDEPMEEDDAADPPEQFGEPVYDSAGDQPDDPLFSVVGPDGDINVWEDGKIGLLSVYYNEEFDPRQTLTVVCREDFVLFDPEGVLEPISDDPEQTVYAMTRPSWQQPCEFTAGDTVMSLFVQLPYEVGAEFVLYDEDLVEAPGQMRWLKHETLTPGQEVQLAIYTFSNTSPGALIPDPVQLLHTDGPLTVYAEPGAAYFTLVPDAGDLTLGIALDRFVTVRVGTGQAVRFAVHQKPYTWEIRNGYTLKSSTAVSLWSAEQMLSGLSHLVRSSDPDIIAVELDEAKPDQFILRPAGFGSATIYLDSEQFTGQVELVVADGEIPLTITQTDPMWTGLPMDETEYGPEILPHRTFAGTARAPFVLPVASHVTITWPAVNSYLWSHDFTASRFTSSDPDIVMVQPAGGHSAYLMPVNPGVCTITYREGPFVREIVVRSEPGAVTRTGCIEPGFYTYYGSAHVHREAVSLEGGLPIVMGIASQAQSTTRDSLHSSRFSFSHPGVARIDLTGSDLFDLVPVGAGATTLRYETPSGAVFTLDIAVGMPGAVHDFVVQDETAPSGYRLWESEQAISGDILEREVFFAQVVLRADGSIHTAELLDFPADISVASENAAVFNLVQREASWWIVAAPRQAGVHSLLITATPPGNSTAQLWEKHLYATDAVVVSERTVAAVNEAIRTAPIVDGYETVILLPSGYISINYSTPVVLDRPVTLRGQGTVLASDIVVLSQTPGAKLQNLNIHFDDTSVCDVQTRMMYPMLYPPQGVILDGVNYAIFGDGLVTLENCSLNGGTGRNRVTVGIGVSGSGVSFLGANTVRNFDSAGWVVQSKPGPRRSVRGLTFENIRIAVSVVYAGSNDPYFMRLIDSNFINNGQNVCSTFPVNFSHNHFSGGTDDTLINKSPQYTQPLAFHENGAVVRYPTLQIEDDRLAAAELVNFEGRAPITSSNFSSGNGPVQITVRELDERGVGVEDSSTALLRWSFAPTVDGAAPPFLPDAHIDEQLNIPPDSGIERYQGVSFSHHGPLPLQGAQISVRKEVQFQEDTLHLYRLADGVLTHLGEIDNTQDEFYTFFLDRCSDYIITNVVVEDAGGDSGPGGGASTNISQGQDGATGPSVPQSDGNPLDDAGQTASDRAPSSPGNAPSSNATAPDREVPPHAAQAAVPAPSTTVYDYSGIPTPATQAASTQRLSANHYVDDAAVRAAFAAPRDGQVMIDVGVRTVVSPLAFQLLAETPSLDLILKGDGYEWRFAGVDASADMRHDAFDTAVVWRSDADSGYARLDFAQQGTLSGNCALVLENAALPRDWAAYDARQARYLPCVLDARQQGQRLTLHLDTLGAYVAIL